jgi:hypothetical protein
MNITFWKYYKLTKPITICFFKTLGLVLGTVSADIFKNNDARKKSLAHLVDAEITRLARLRINDETD